MSATIQVLTIDLDEGGATEAVVLENSTLRAEFIPSLGGTLRSLLDKRTGLEVLALPGIRFAVLPSQPRPTVWSVNEEACEWSFATHVQGVSVAATIAIHPTEPKLQVDVLTQNRHLTEWMDCDLGVEWPARGSDQHGRPGAFLSYDAVGKVGVALFGEPDFAGRVDGDCICKHPTKWTLAPRQTEAFRILIVPASGLPSVDVFTDSLALSVGEVLHLQAARPILDGRIDLLGSDDQTWSAPFTAYPERALALPLPEGVRQIAVVQSREVVAVWPEARHQTVSERGVSEFPAWWTEAVASFGAGTTEELELHLGRSLAGAGGLSRTLLGTAALRKGRPADACRWFEEALRHSADDALLWWALAFARRLAGLDDPNEEREALLTAHEVAPLEPMLRIEAFLSQPTQHRDPSPLLTPLAQVPGMLAECGEVLMATGVYEQAARFFDEALRHSDEPTLRYLYAATMLRSTNLKAQAAEQLQRAAKSNADSASLGVEGRRAIAEIAAAFPGLIGPRGRGSTETRD